jgi:hypothetical protein
MRGSDLAKIDRLALMMVRQNKERSRALPAKSYRDPAETFEFPAEIQRQKALKQQQRLREKEMLRRVRKQDVQHDTFAKPDGLNVCLGCWKDFMLSDDRDLSASCMKLRNGAEENAVGFETDVYAEQRKADMKIGEATDAMIDSLRHVHRWAIYKKCGISTVWNFPSADFIQMLIDAEEELTKKLKINIATANLFL